MALAGNPRAPLTCPFDQNEMVPLMGGDAAMALLDVLIDPRSAIRGMMQGAANTRINGQVQKCHDCGFIAVFNKQKGR